MTGLLTNDTVVGLIPFLYTPALIFQAIFSLLYGGILVYLSFASRHYKIGGWCCIAAAIIGWSGLFTDPDGWGNLISIISSVVSLVGTYHVFYGHAEVLEFPDSDLAERWRKLFKWRVGMIAVNIGSVILALIPFLALLAMPAVIACAIAMVVVGILQIVYLYRTAKVFRNFPEEYPNRYSNLGPEQGEAGPTGQTAMIKKAAVEGDKKICPHCGQRQDKGNTICMNCGEMI